MLGLCCYVSFFSSCGALASYCHGFFHCGARARGTRASGGAPRGVSSCGPQALDHRLSSCAAGVQLLWGMWDLPKPGIKPMSLGLQAIYHWATREAPEWNFEKQIWMWVWFGNYFLHSIPLLFSFFLFVLYLLLSFSTAYSVTSYGNEKEFSYP